MWSFYFRTNKKKTDWIKNEMVCTFDHFISITIKNKKYPLLPPSKYPLNLHSFFRGFFVNPDSTEMSLENLNFFQFYWFFFSNATKYEQQTHTHSWLEVTMIYFWENAFCIYGLLVWYFVIVNFVWDENALENISE